MKEIVFRAAHITPSDRQAAWQKLEFYAFIHFGMNTFSDREWGDGTESPALFNPTAFDASQWVAVCKAAGMKGLILTAKHHDGFCLWPSAYTEHSVKNSPWKNGRGDVIAEVARACHEAGLKFGIYCSPWDRHESTYGDSPAYNEHFKNQLRELLTNYGELFCVWFDGACGEGPNGKRQVYAWEEYYALIRELQPHAVISVMGPDVRWCGNEAGETRQSEWSVLPVRNADRATIAEKAQHADDPAFASAGGSEEDLGSREKIMEAYESGVRGQPRGAAPTGEKKAPGEKSAAVEKSVGASELIWFPAEVNTSIRPGWFYHASQDSLVKPLGVLLDIYYGAVGGNATFLLNFPPDKRGLIHENDAARARELGKVLNETFRTNLALGAKATASGVRGGDQAYGAGKTVDGDENTYWTTDDWQDTASIEYDLGAEKTFNVAMLQEYIRAGQRVEDFALDVQAGGTWKEIARSTVIGYKRLLRFEPVTARKVRVRILRSRVCPTMANFGLFLAPR
ncbi:alpha-L-fucosidase [bacterium]|nr:alpha-L-fucosidase [bacterium]